VLRRQRLRHAAHDPVKPNGRGKGGGVDHEFRYK
jgi:hypothetical protein